MLSYINMNEYILMVNPSKYFTNQDVWANMPIISNCFLEFFKQAIPLSIFFEPAISVVKNVKKKHTENMQQIFISRMNLFLMWSVSC